MNLFEALVKGFYTVRSMSEGLWTRAMADELAAKPKKLQERVKRVGKWLADSNASFEEILQQDSLDNRGLEDLKVLQSREICIAKKLNYTEALKNANAEVLAQKSHLKDTVSILSGALTESQILYQQEIAWLTPRITEASKVRMVAHGIDAGTQKKKMHSSILNIFLTLINYISR